jgi:hypothetical protein
VVFEPVGDETEAAIDAYEAKYPGSSAVPIMPGPKGVGLPNPTPYAE